MKPSQQLARAFYH